MLAELWTCQLRVDEDSISCSIYARHRRIYPRCSLLDHLAIALYRPTRSLYAVSRCCWLYRGLDEVAQDDLQDCTSASLHEFRLVDS